MSDRITAELEYQGIQRDEDGWEHHAYRATLRYQGRQLTTPFKTGTGWTEEPTAADILESLLSDASSVDASRGFEDWAADYGYDTDSRKAHALYLDVARQTDRLARLLGADYPYGAGAGVDSPDEIAARLTDATVQA